MRRALISALISANSNLDAGRDSWPDGDQCPPSPPTQTSPCLINKIHWRYISEHLCKMAIYYLPVLLLLLLVLVLVLVLFSTVILESNVAVSVNIS